MEYVYSFIINKVVKDFKGVAIAVKTDEQVFVFILPLAKTRIPLFSSCKDAETLRKDAPEKICVCRPYVPTLYLFHWLSRHR